MATTGKFDARILKIYTGGTPVAITHQTNATFSASGETIDVTTKDSSGFRETLAGLKSWTMSGDAMFAFDATNGYSALFTAWHDGTAVAVVFQTAISGDKKYSGSAFITNLELSGAGVGTDPATFSFTLEGNGAITEAVVLHYD